MKTIYLLITIVITFTSCIVHNPTTYIPVMPNNPMFEKPDEVSINGGISFDHVEGQFGASPIRNFGITGGMYSGAKGIHLYEFGLIGYKNIANNFYGSFSIGGGTGSLKGEYQVKSPGADDDFYKTDIRFNSYYFQPSVYYCFHTNGAVLKLIAACKFESVGFSSFNISFINKNNFSNPNFSFTNTADNPSIRIITPYMGMRYEYKQLFFDIQYGSRNVQDTFHAKQTNSQTGGRNIPNPLNNQLHPLFDRGMLNITVGLKFSPFSN